MPRVQHHPSPTERNERVKLDLPPDEAIAAILEAGPHPEDEAQDEKTPKL
jgi:hypothetical protein